MPRENIRAQASGCPVKDRSFFACCNMRTNRSPLGKRVYDIKLHSANMRISLTSFMRNQFIAGLTSKTLGVKLIGKGHRHRDAAQAKVKLPEVV